VLRDDQPTVLTITAAALAVFLLAVAGVVALMGPRTLARVCLVVAVVAGLTAAGLATWGELQYRGCLDDRDAWLASHGHVIVDLPGAAHLPECKRSTLGIHDPF
jgi:xanthine/uracil permease